MPAAHPPEFRRRALDLVAQGNPVAQTARDLGISESCLLNWMNRDAVDAGRKAGVTSDEHRELVELRRRNRVLEMEIEIQRARSAVTAAAGLFRCQGVGCSMLIRSVRTTTAATQRSGKSLPCPGPGATPAAGPRRSHGRGRHGSRSENRTRAARPRAAGLATEPARHPRGIGTCGRPRRCRTARAGTRSGAGGYGWHWTCRTPSLWGSSRRNERHVGDHESDRLRVSRTITAGDRGCGGGGI